jgi:molybdopterin converting factor small subunit
MAAVIGKRLDSMITVRIPEPLRDGHEIIAVSAGVQTLGDLIAILERDLPGFADDRDELFNFAVNGELVIHGEVKTALCDGDEVEIVVAFSGG